MLTETMQKSLNEQFNRELYSSYLYLSMAAWFTDRNLPGFAHWMTLQSQEEYAHAMKFYHFINERRGRVTLEAIERPDGTWESPLAAFEGALHHEQLISGHINDLSDLAVKEKDHASQIFLQWFVSEQVEEESTADEIVQKIRMIGDSPQGLFLIDQELAARQLSAVSEPAE